MAQDVRVIVLRTAGTNCDGETAYAFERCGAAVDLVHINRLSSGEVSLGDYHILAVPGGFTYGDDIMSGRILANELRLNLGKDLEAFIASGKLVLGICNGFQVLVRAGILPGPLSGQSLWHPGVPQTVSLTHNDSGKFEDRWVRLKVSGVSVWTEGLGDTVLFPVAHAEGKFMTRDDAVLRSLRENGQVIFRYCSEDGQSVAYPGNPNGSMDHIAGIADRTGRVLGLMPHPERHFVVTQHPAWTRLGKKSGYGEGARIFQNGVTYVKDNLIKN
ncbi:MAG TPA: phosphoribosylformylglycinamidine synthase I [Candidatus Omnitrophota bacterium]|nr:phosphoribosylformylglycinamidine synthase I [Candidatus Omnitrophota bacterium]HPN55316.1 phosphoribosylformylglycinamidine synthase I [Candidatus Omnitrophota bacterium]